MLGVGACVTLTQLACGSPPPVSEPNSTPSSQPADSADSKPPPAANETWSPQLVSLHPADRAVLEGCGLADAGLMRVATELAEYQARHGRLMNVDEVTFELRQAGVPYVWPRAWAIEGTFDAADVAEGLQALVHAGTHAHLRCGLGRTETTTGTPVLVVLAADALAELSPLPRRASPGQWVRIEANLLRPAAKVDVIALGPTGRPRTLLSELRDGHVRATLALSAPGPWTIQVLPTFAEGPRPALEAVIHVGQSPPTEFRAQAVPGEDASGSSAEPAERLLAMLNAARASEGLAPLPRHAQLDVAAAIQAKAMWEAGLVAHDVGLGDPIDRLEALGLSPRVAGENVAHARSLRQAHRALWASPAHRANLLLDRFTDIGIGVVESEDGSVWVCQVFAEFSSPR